jgi:hypothetical protein
MQMCKGREKKFYMVKDTCLDSSLTAAQGLALRDLEDYRRLHHLNNSDQKQAIYNINKKVHQTESKC